MANIIFAPYFTKNIHFHQHDSSHNGRGGSKPDDYKLMKKWYDSVMKFDLEAIIFHNEHSNQFIQKYQTTKLKFVKWSGQSRPSYNDERFYAYFNYLKLHEEIENVFMTDLFDVQFWGNPFELIQKETSYNLFFGEEMMSKSSSKWMIRKCKEMKLPLIKNKYAPGCMIFNAGIIGGRRESILDFLRRMIKTFKTIPKRFNANMPVFNYCADSLKDQIYSGSPLHNKFRSHKITEGVYIQHK